MREVQVRATDLKVGDLVKSYVEFVPHMRVTRAPLPSQYGRVDWEHTLGTHYCSGTTIYTVLDLTVPEPGWGEVYAGPSPAYQTPEGLVWMFRAGQRVRFYDEAGQQVGPEQSNVAPAVAFALSQWWFSL